METIKLLLAHADRRLNNQMEVAVLDVCYDLAVVQPTRTARLDEFVRQGSLWEFDLIIVGVDNLYLNRSEHEWVTPADVANAIRTIRSHSSTPIIALAANAEAREVLLEAGAHSVLKSPFKPEQLKSEVRPLLDLGELVESGESSGWSGIGSLFRGLQRAKAVD
jgi:CheY-like chemotaxis protein